MTVAVPVKLAVSVRCTHTTLFTDRCVFGNVCTTVATPVCVGYAKTARMPTSRKPVQKKQDAPHQLPTASGRSSRQHEPPGGHPKTNAVRIRLRPPRNLRHSTAMFWHHTASQSVPPSKRTQRRRRTVCLRHLSGAVNNSHTPATAPHQSVSKKHGTQTPRDL